MHNIGGGGGCEGDGAHLQLLSICCASAGTGGACAEQVRPSVYVPVLLAVAVRAAFGLGAQRQGGYLGLVGSKQTQPVVAVVAVAVVAVVVVVVAMCCCRCWPRCYTQLRLRLWRQLPLVYLLIGAACCVEATEGCGSARLSPARTDRNPCRCPCYACPLRLEYLSGTGSSKQLAAYEKRAGVYYIGIA
ncbi:hypothetical protein PLESTB_001041700 [Pleodorina starrii]|uniref:Uncharacterized protein n=1 Tax=Pleodorina starrii TaxID=330485 RepID=A0A9W6BQ30_9CHLO|nr:hypothetical protein PLESTB_001041700 [Pleodorina starrii]GLC63890.1 hypothetical protein PLESTF_000094800 [Pleodorina starrii]